MAATTTTGWPTLALAICGAACMTASPAMAQTMPTGMGESAPATPEAKMTAQAPEVDKQRPASGTPLDGDFRRGGGINVVMLLGGVTLVGFNYMLSVVAASSLDPPEGELSADPYSNAISSNRSLYAPLIGPFIAAGAERSGGQRAMLIADGVMQLAGTWLAVSGLWLERKRLARQDATAVQLKLSPGGLQLRGSF